MPARIALLALLVCAFLVPTASSDEARVLRFPTLHGDDVVFSFAGDLYTVKATGGTARRLTSHPGYEIFARFSPDGKTLAFTAEYDGNREVYVMPAQGGSPVRVTFTPTLSRDDVSDRMGPNNIVMAWRDNGTILFRSRMREHNSFNGQLYLASVTGGTPVQVKLPRGGFGSFSPDGKKLAYNRVFREFRTWKRYRGGMADDVWIHDLETRETRNITNDPAQDIIPMWHGNRVYFLSDRGPKKRMNLYVHDLGSGQTRRLTNFEEFDIKFPSLGNDAIVFECGGYLYRFDLATEDSRRIPVTIADDAVHAQTELISLGDRVSNYEISPDGKRALFGARGEIFTVPGQHGRTRNLTSTSGIHERDSKWSPDGKSIAFISDRSGNDEIWIIAQDGKGEPRQITSTGDTYIYQISWSPDSKRILWADKMLRLRYVDLESKEIVGVAQATAWEIRQYTWSHDGKWIAYARNEEQTMTRVYLYSVESRETFPITDGWYDSNSPAFSADGKVLFFVSDRDFSPTYSATEWNHSYANMSRLYLVTLAAATPSPFEPENDEVTIKDDEPEKDGEKKLDGDGEKKDDGKKDAAMVVDTTGLPGRILGLPVPPGNYGGLGCAGSRVFYQYSRSGDPGSASFKSYDLEKKKEADHGRISGYEISADGKKMLVSQGGSYGIIDLPSGPIKIEDTIDLSGMTTRLDRRAEWLQIYRECWRQMRDFFFAPNMHGVNWESMRLRYEPLARAVYHRHDLNYVIGELIGELNVGHAYVGGGDIPPVPRTMAVGMLGGILERDPGSGFYRIARILEGQNWPGGDASPLTRLGVDVKEGEYLVAIEGRSTADMLDMYEALMGTVGKQVLLSVNATPTLDGAREVTVIPISDELSLYYTSWVEDNIRKVTEATSGRVGYIHVPDMGVNGLNEFVKRYYPQLRKEALIIDVRGNGGGNVSPMLIERLLREPVFFDMARNTAVGTDPGGLHLGPKICLVNEFSASDGDIFPYRFKHHKIGPLIGKRSWGGVVGIRGSLPLVDGGSLNKPEFANFDPAGKEWVIEGHGVDPDIVVDNDPAKEYDGIDQQLDKAIEVALAELEKNPVKVPEVPPFPDKSK